MHVKKRELENGYTSLTSALLYPTACRVAGREGDGEVVLALVPCPLTKFTNKIKSLAACADFAFY